MTEDEARTKWCPFARVIILGGGGPPIGPANRAVGADGKEGDKCASCIASRCMAWRWSPALSYASGYPEKVTPTKGYCGLARAPQ